MSRRAFDRAERAARPLTELLFATVRAQGALYGVFERQTREILHFWNMPTHGDVRRVNRQLGALSAEVRDLAALLEQQSEGSPGTTVATRRRLIAQAQSPASSDRTGVRNVE